MFPDIRFLTRSQPWHPAGMRSNPYYIVQQGKAWLFCIRGHEPIKSQQSLPQNMAYGISMSMIVPKSHGWWSFSIIFRNQLPLALGYLQKGSSASSRYFPWDFVVLGFRGLLTPVGWWNQAPQSSTVIHIQMPRYFGIYHIFSHPKTVSSWWLYVYIYIYYIHINILSHWIPCRNPPGIISFMMQGGRAHADGWSPALGAVEGGTESKMCNLSTSHQHYAGVSMGQQVSASDFNFTRVDNKDQHYAGVSIRFFNSLRCWSWRGTVPHCSRWHHNYLAG